MDLASREFGREDSPKWGRIAKSVEIAKPIRRTVVSVVRRRLATTAKHGLSCRFASLGRHDRQVPNDRRATGFHDIGSDHDAFGSPIPWRLAARTLPAGCHCVLRCSSTSAASPCSPCSPCSQCSPCRVRVRPNRIVGIGLFCLEAGRKHRGSNQAADAMERFACARHSRASTTFGCGQRVSGNAVPQPGGSIR